MNYTQQQIDEAWGKATKVDGFNPDNIRKDSCGAWIIRGQYSSRDSIYGWEIDHVYPKSLGGDEHPDNLRAMQWENNVAKGNDFPSYQVSVQAEGIKNVHKEDNYTINSNLLAKLRTLYHL